jgi:hypothetical protein
MNTASDSTSVPIDGRTIQLERLRELSLHQQHFSERKVFIFVPEPAQQGATEAFMSARMKQRAFLTAGFQCAICRPGDDCVPEAVDALHGGLDYFIVQRPLTSEELGIERLGTSNLDTSGDAGFKCSALTETVLRILAPFVARGALSIGLAGSRGHFGSELTAELNSRGLEVSGCDRGDAMDCLASARIVISAVGKPGIISQSQLRTPKEVLIDVGYTFDEATGRAFGDFQSSCYELSRFYTPVPGGVGPLQVLTLVERAAVKTGYGVHRPWTVPCKPSSTFRRAGKDDTEL